MIFGFLIIVVIIILLFVSVSRSIASKKAGHRSSWPIVSVITGAVLFFIVGIIFYFGDYYSAKYWIEVVPIRDASSQNKGTVGFTLPAGNYLIEVDREGDAKQDDRLIIKYVLDVPQEGLKIEKEKKLDFILGVRQQRLDRFILKKNKANGVFFVEILQPSNNKISVRLVTDRYLDM